MVNISSAAVAALFFATFPVALVAQEDQNAQLVKAELHEVTSERKRELQTLDSYTHLDRNKAVNASLNMANGNNEVEIEFLRAELPGMFNTSDLENNRINARFYPARQVGGSWECAKTGPYTENGMTGDAKLITSASYPSTFDDLTVSPDSEIYYDADQKKFMNATVQDKMGIGGETSQEPLTPPGGTVQQHERIKLTINFAKDEFGPNNPIWDGNVDGTDGEVSFCVNLNIEDRFVMNETAGEYMWHSYLWRDFIVIMGFDLTRNIFSIGDENGQEITVTVAEVEQTQDYTYVSPNATIYQCRDDPTGSGGNNLLRSNDDGADIAQNGQIQLCISADSDEVDIGSIALRVYEGEPDIPDDEDWAGTFPLNDVRLQRVFDAGWPNTPLVPVVDDNSPAGVAEYPQIVRVYTRDRVQRNIDYTSANYQTGTGTTVLTDVQKIDIQTLTSQANKNLTIVGNVKWEFRRNRRRLGAPDSAAARALQAAADDGAGASEFTFVVPVTGLEHDADKTDPVNGAAQDDSNGETDTLQSYSAAVSVAEVGFLKMLGAAAVAAVALLF